MKITAAITTYKRDWETLNRAIESAESQTYPMHEILVVDDNEKGSPYSETIKENIKNRKNVKYLSQGKNTGVSGARNYAIENATGDWIAFLDDDDYWLPGKIEAQSKEAIKHPYAGIVFVYGEIRDKNDHVKGNTWQKQMFMKNPTHLDMLTHDYVGSASAPLINLEAIKSVNGFRKMPAVEDYDCWIRISRRYTVWGIDESMYVKNMPEGEHVSRNHKNTFRGYREIYRYNKEKYQHLSNARRWIAYNIMREGIKSMQIAVIPYCFMWLEARLRRKK